jgi:type II secretory pathway pseudopilin PulG
VRIEPARGAGRASSEGGVPEATFPRGAFSETGFKEPGFREPRFGEHGSGEDGSGESGFTMVAVVIGMLLLSIAIAAIGPAIGNIGKRDREEELIFRGRQYARGVALFQRRFGRYPNTLKEMYENNPRVLRHLWKDPMCNCDDWYLIILNSPDANPLAGGSGLPPAGGGTFARPTPTPTPPPSGTFGTPTTSAGPIIGVRSKVHREGLQEWRGQKFYDQWKFIVGDADKVPGNFDPNSLGGRPLGPPIR